MMRNTCGLLLLLALCAGCVTRIGIYAPRRADTPEHRRATANADCRACHDVSTRKNHSATDDCLRCHVLCRGC